MSLPVAEVIQLILDLWDWISSHKSMHLSWGIHMTGPDFTSFFVAVIKQNIIADKQIMWL